MKNSEEAMEKVLAGLRDAETPAGMESRILDALEKPTSARVRSGWRWLRPMWLVAPAHPVAIGSVACGVALAAIVAVALAIPAIRRLGHSPAQSRINLAPAGSLPLTTSETAAKSVLAPLAAVGARSVEKTNVRGKMDVRTAEAVREGDGDSSGDSSSMALSEMRAGNHPAPPMPLTEQERLLLRIAHKGDPVEMAMLDPKLRAVQDKEEETEFQRFFGATKIVQQTTGQPETEQQTTEQPATSQPATEEPTTERSTRGDNK